LESAREALQPGKCDRAALLSVHSGISAADALCVGIHGMRCTSESHTDAVELIRQLFGTTESVSRGASHLMNLLACKHNVEYEARLCTLEDARRAVERAERFLEFVVQQIGST
jgi:hypothetical protein